MQVVLTVLYEMFRFQLTTFQSFIVSQGVLIIPALIYIYKNRINVLEFIRFKRIPIMTVFLICIMTFFLIPVLNFVSTVSMLFSTNFISGAVNDLVTKESFLLSLVTIAVIPAILEESVYRGVFFHEYSKRNTGKAILMSAFFFGLLHMNLNQFSYAVVMGIIFCFIIEATDSIVSTMIVHFLINGSSAVLLKIQPYIANAMKQMAEITGQSADVTGIVEQTMSKEYLISLLPSLAVSAIISGIIAMVIFYVIAVQNHRWEHIKSIFLKTSVEETNHEKERFLTKPVVFIMIFEVAFMIYREVLVRV